MTLKASPTTAQDTATDRTLKSTRLTVLIVSCLAGFLAPFMVSAVNIALPGIGYDLSMSAVALGWVASSYFLSSASLLVPFGRLADMFGRKKLFAIGMTVFGMGSLLCSVASSTPFFIASRVLQGTGTSMALGTAIAMLTSVYPLGERGRVLGINAASNYIGLCLGPLLGGLLTDHAGWRSIFVFGFAASLLTVLVTMWKLRSDWAEAKGEGFDYGGAVLFAVFLVALIYGLTSLPDLLGVLLLAIAAVTIVIFAAWEDRAPSPLIHMSLFRHNPAFVFSNLASLIGYAATYAVTFLLSLYLQYNKGLSPEAAGLILVISPAVQFVLSPLMGRLSDRVEPRRLASIGMVIMTVGIGLLIFLGRDTSIAYLVICLLVLGAGLGFFASPNTNAVMTSVSRQWYGVASSAMVASRQVGAMLSMGIAMLVFAVVIGRVAITPALYDDFARSARIAFIIFTALCLAGVFASLARGNVRDEDTAAGPR